ncbi:MAG: hypothetical protein HQK83_06050 [Fibrobacteria bacterium]|nr:hypothetical protein [Fibrobacteria bacterium]
MKVYLFRSLPLLLLIALIACSTNRPLITRGLNSEERRHFVVQNGYGISEENKRSFLDGFPLEGMSQDLIFQLYGAPDRTDDDDTLWEYVDRRGMLITGFRFENKKVTAILGDRRGGLPLEQPEP